MSIDLPRINFWLWMAVFVVWAISSLASKRTVGSHSEWQSRVAVWVVGIAWWLLFIRPPSGPLALRLVPAVASAQLAGFILTVAGLGLALWARFYLGRNWSALVEMKEDHQLMCGGPYAIVRHPIYSGFMAATLGTAIAVGELHGLISFVLVLVAWGYKSRLEEKALIGQFGQEYEKYRGRVKGLIPFVW
jgi:protein-S-isoprenylcysteine O-methyltransferase Ste14